MNVFQLIYSSRATYVPTHEELSTIVKTSVAKNNLSGITGMLIYIYDDVHQCGRFVQVLEGDESEVKRIFDEIIRDKRHCAILLHHEGKVKARNFASWSMGFKTILPGECASGYHFAELTKSFLLKGKQRSANSAIRFLRAFCIQALG